MTEPLKAEHRDGFVELFARQPKSPERLELPRNRRGRDLFVGDVHGHPERLDELLKAAEVHPTRDRIIFVGDLVARGPDSLGALRKVMGMTNAFSVRGNHDEEALQAILRDTDSPMVRYFDDTPHRRLPDVERLLFGGFLHSLPLTIRLKLSDGRIAGVVHGELSKDRHWEDALDRTLALRGRTRATVAINQLRDQPKDYSADVIPHLVIGLVPPDKDHFRPIVGTDIVISGHTPIADKPVGTDGFMWIDTGGGFSDGWLSIVDPVSEQYWSVGPGGCVRQGVMHSFRPEPIRRGTGKHYGLLAGSTRSPEPICLWL